jgi:hypothetical protein
MAAHHDPRSAALKDFLQTIDIVNDFDPLRLTDRHCC